MVYASDNGAVAPRHIEMLCRMQPCQTKLSDSEVQAAGNFAHIVSSQYISHIATHVS